LINGEKLKTVLTGIQSSGIPHLGNILGAIKPAIEMSQQKDMNGIFFIADYHALTSIKNKELLHNNTLSVVACWLACGLDISNNIFFKQSDVIEVMELTWVLNCFTPYPMLANAHSFKDKQENLADVNSGLFTYPVLMAADILLYDVHYVPVGKDQIQHLEMTRDIANKFNVHYQTDFFILPEVVVNESIMTIPGIDGRKMSKSYDNTIDIFLPEKQLKKRINQIVTDSKEMEEAKDPETCNVFTIYKTLANEKQSKDLEQKYRAGNFGYGHAKAALFELIMDQFSDIKKNYDQIITDHNYLKNVLSKGAEKAKIIAEKKIKRLRDITGYQL
jgi:tryptophanyl-tRNA synthetase